LAFTRLYVNDKTGLSINQEAVVVQSRKAVSIIGQGKVGSTMTACFASKGYKVVGVDINPELVENIRQFKSSFQEPRVQELLTANRERIHATMSYPEAISATDMTFIIVPTPSMPNGSFSAKFVCSACEQIGAALKTKDSWHLVVITSTVLPGTTEKEIIPALERASGKKCGVDFDLCYSPLFIALGSVANNILKPDFVLVGESSSRAGELLDLFYKSVIENSASIQRMNIINAEISKITVNAYVTTKISFANQLAEICEGLPHADADVVSRAIGCDTRIGSKYLKAGTAFGGPCFPRDNRAYQHTAEIAGTSAPMAAATDEINLRQGTRLVKMIKKHLKPGGAVGILGMAYKPDTPILDESPGVYLATLLAKESTRIISYDYLGNDEVKKMNLNKVEIVSSVETLLQKADIIVITQAIPEYKFQMALAQNKCVIDCWGILNQNEWSKNSNYIRLGLSQV
jgi:UDPglucose 6-dehydrogenase